MIVQEEDEERSENGGKEEENAEQVSNAAGIWNSGSERKRMKRSKKTLRKS